MSNMSFMEKLLDGVAVEWKVLRKITLPTSNIRWRDTDRSYRYIDLARSHAPAWERILSLCKATHGSHAGAWEPAQGGSHE